MAAELWDHMRTATGLADVRGIAAEFAGPAEQRALRLRVTERDLPLTCATVPAPDQGWDLAHAGSVVATVRNCGTSPVRFMVWVVGSNGWGAVGDIAALETGGERRFHCDLRETYPDGTPKLDPGHIGRVRFILDRPQTDASVEIRGLAAGGMAPVWQRPPGRLDVPPMTTGVPAPGRRVNYQLPDDAGTGIYCALYLPPEWEPAATYPVIAEFPGNLFINERCYSTGRPEQCVMGYGISEGKGAIWVSLPFINRQHGTIAESGFGANEGDDTAAYTVQVMEHICRTWSGDRRNLVLAGFSRGAIACGYIGLKNARIAPLWKGFCACQHYDGSNWRQSNIDGAVERAHRFSGKGIFQTDNSPARYHAVVEATNPSVIWTWVSSGLRFHDTAMFLDDRPSTRKAREWFSALVDMP